MKPTDLFEKLHHGKFTKGAEDLDYSITINIEEQTIYVAFQETRSIKDWKVNFNFPAKIYKQQQKLFMVARGWGNVWRANNDKIIYELLPYIQNNPNFKICFCGYSYGGAMAQIACEDFYFRTGRKVDELITFGSPKPIFGLHSLKVFRESVIKASQYTCINDIVTFTVPFPLYFRINTTKVGKFVFGGIFKPLIWHLSYDRPEYYN